MFRRDVLPLALRVLLTLLVGIWFGIWFLGPAVLIFADADDPRDIFDNPLSLVGSGVLALGRLYFVVQFFIYGDLPEQARVFSERGWHSWNRVPDHDP